VNREVHAPICGSPGARFPRATRLEKAEVDSGQRPGTTSDDKKRIADLEKEVRELRRANEILKAASAYFARELDPGYPR